jgi:LytS/YehU family sensor histidine kinase
MKKSIQAAVSALRFLFSKKRKYNEVKSQVTELQTQLANMQMKVLRLQMNPHFLFNSLNAISDYICRNNTADANRYVIKLSRLMRMILENAEQTEVSLAQDLEVLELYMQLESLRLGNVFTCEIRVAPNVDVQHTMIPPLLLQPFVENSIWHGVARNKAGKITIGIERKKNTLLCSIEDNGMGNRAVTAPAGYAAIHTKKPLGIKITKQRVALLGQAHQVKTSVQLMYSATGAKATLTLPLLLET